MAAVEEYVRKVNDFVREIEAQRTIGRAAGSRRMHRDTLQQALVADPQSPPQPAQPKKRRGSPFWLPQPLRRGGSASGAPRVASETVIVRHETPIAFKALL